MGSHQEIRKISSALIEQKGKHVTGILRQFLFRKKTIAVVGVLAVVMVGVGIRLRRDLERDREMIDIANRLMIRQGTWRFTNAAKVINYDNDTFTVEGYDSSLETYHLVARIEKYDDEWMVSEFTVAGNQSFWKRIKKYARSWLP